MKQNNNSRFWRKFSKVGKSYQHTRNQEYLTLEWEILHYNSYEIYKTFQISNFFCSIKWKIESIHSKESMCSIT